MKDLSPAAMTALLKWLGIIGLKDRVITSEPAATFIANLPHEEVT